MHDHRTSYANHYEQPCDMYSIGMTKDDLIV